MTSKYIKHQISDWSSIFCYCSAAVTSSSKKGTVKFIFRLSRFSSRHSYLDSHWKISVNIFIYFLFGLQSLLVMSSRHYFNSIRVHKVVSVHSSRLYCFCMGQSSCSLARNMSLTSSENIFCNSATATTLDSSFAAQTEHAWMPSFA